MTADSGGRCAVLADSGDLVTIFWDGALVWANDLAGYRTTDGRCVTL
jgi:hypothetical protein